MKWDEFCALLSGLSAESPLGRVVQIRAEDNSKILEKFTPHQRKIRSDWRAHHARKVTSQNSEEMLEFLKNTFIKMAGGVVRSGS